MLAGILHEGSGLGDQLFRYITVRTLAEKKGFDWGMVPPEAFKGLDFMRIDTGKPVDELKNNPKLKYFDEKEIRQGSLDIRSYDPEINFVEDNTIIDGSFEDDKYWRHNLDNINKWLEVERLEVPDTTCVVGFRGGEYASIPDLFLRTDYYFPALLQMSPSRYEVHTDDPNMAKDFFSTYDVPVEVVENTQISHSKHSNMGFNWRSMRFAKYAIIPNSAFYILPRILKHHEDPTAVTIAPRYWARRNRKIWARPACYYKEFTYI